MLNTELECSVGTGAQSKYNRTKNSYPKEHWIDAACVGDAGLIVLLNPEMQILRVKSMGHGSRPTSKILAESELEIMPVSEFNFWLFTVGANRAYASKLCSCSVSFNYSYMLGELATRNERKPYRDLATVPPEGGRY
jgi:hypothetical protein